MSMFASIDEALTDFREGKFLVVLDDEDRENEGDLIIAAEKATEEKIAFMIRYTGGVICTATTEARLNELELPQMVRNNTDPKKTAFTISIDYKIGTTTGISAADRAKTISALANSSCKAVDFQRPGHVFPLRYSPGGVLVRSGHTEASVDLCRLAGLYPAGALSEIMDDNGKMMRRDELSEFSKKHDIKMITIAALIEYRYASETLVSVPPPPIPHHYPITNKFGTFDVYLFRSNLKNELDIAYTYGDIDKGPCIVRIQRECVSGMFGPCGCYLKAELALRESAKFGRGVLLIIRSSSSVLPHNINDSNQNKLTETGIGAQILRHLNVKEMRLLTTSPQITYYGIEGYGLKLVETVIIKRCDNGFEI